MYKKRSLRKKNIFTGGLSTTFALSIMLPLSASEPSASPEPEVPLHISQAELNKLLATGNKQQAFMLAFDVGDELFEHSFTAEDGVGAHVGNGQRFTLVPRADLTEDTAWATHYPKRVTGPNAQSCVICHGTPVGDGAGRAVMNNIRDPQHSGQISQFINRQAPHIFGIGALQRLAEEMSEELHQIRQQTIAQAKANGRTQNNPLISKGISFGTLIAHADGSLDTRQLSGIDPDLLVKPIEWKGITASIRAFVRDASHNELGMQAVEITGDNVDGDGDGIANELSVGDVTAMVIYQAAQPRPTTKLELASLGLIPELSQQQQQQIHQGKRLFVQAGCDSCHQPKLLLNNPVYTEPSQNPDYREETFPAGQNALAQGVNPAQPISFDLTKDLPDNIIELDDGSRIHLGNFQQDESGRAIVRLFGDLKRHDMGNELAESIDEAGTGAATFITKELWGVGSTAPYLHDGRATTLQEAITFHGGEAAAARASFRDFSTTQQAAVIAFLENLVLYKSEEE